MFVAEIFSYLFAVHGLQCSANCGMTGLLTPEQSRDSMRSGGQFRGQATRCAHLHILLLPTSSACAAEWHMSREQTPRSGLLGHRPQTSWRLAERRVQHAAGWQEFRGLALRLLLLCTLILASGWRQGVVSSASDGPLPRHLSRRLLSQLPVPDPVISQYSQAVFLPRNATASPKMVLLPYRAPVGTLLSEAAGTVSPEECGNLCYRQKQCNAFRYCMAPGPCVNASYNLSAAGGACQLVFQDKTASGTGRPLLVVDSPGFVGGAPIRFSAPEVPGYEAWPGLGFWYRYDYNCNDSVSQPGSCGLRGGPQENAARCNSDPACQVMMWFPDGRDYPGAGQPVVLLKGAANVELQPTEANINTNAVLYKKKDLDMSTRNSLTGAGIAGVVVGGFCGVCIVLLGAYLAARAAPRDGGKKRRGSSTGSQATGAPGSVITATDGGSLNGLVPYGTVAVHLGDGKTAFRKADGLGWAHSSNPSNPSTLKQVPSSAASSEALAAAHITGVAAEGPGRPFAACPETPPPSVASGISFLERTGPIIPIGISPPSSVPIIAPPAAGTSPVATVVTAAAAAAGSPPVQAAVPAATAAAVGRAPNGQHSPGYHPLLQHLPNFNWQRSVVDFSSIQFVVGPDGRYEELGSGASATVYKVLLNGVEPHAAKVFCLGSDAQAQLYFLEEVSLLRLLRHKSIVGFAGVCVAGGNGIILMELMEGGDLRSHHGTKDPAGNRLFSWYNRGRTVALDVALGLHYLHTSSYTHFDVKSRNVLLSRDGTAKLADVGFTRAMRATHHSIEGPTGTFDYMAPELLTGKKCNSSVDIYSFGVLLWEICVGRYPTRGSMRDPQVPEECPQEVADLMRQCMTEDPALRPTAAQLVARLTELQ